MSRKLGFKTFEGFHGMEAERVCDILSTIGYASIEWDMSFFDPRKTTRDQRKRLREVPDSLGMDVSDVCVQHDYVTLSEDERRDRIEHTIECIRAAAEAGIPAINVYTGPRFWIPGNPRLHYDIPEGKAWDLVFDAYSRMLPVAEKHGVTLLVECCFGMVCRNYYTMKYLIDHFNSDYLRINADPSHDYLARSDIPWVIRQWGKKIGHAHLKDAVGVPGFPGDTFTYPLPGDGRIDWKTFFSAFDDIGYTGAFTVEFEAMSYYESILKEDPVKAAQISYERIGRLLESET
ncbi:MAG: sugar phosphate isomerase/epimerase [Armatimonadetes bacterium]|nr:sugar phosphate isomerase/epimerase [Armatimonadota bacterium]